ncbi:MAG TPA: AAA family ATPase [Candidatus Caccenecus avistercoris]|nr:AAA family ATPase [Candidatus Caccenecus avistercoris]
MLIGARQTRKTYILDEFCRKNFLNYIYINLEKESEISQIFNQTINSEEIIENIKILKNIQFDVNNTVIFFDEIQVNERAITSLKYFCESDKPYKLVCADSLLGVKIHRFTSSFPVGMVIIKYLYPMDFEEFLMALGEEQLLSEIKKHYMSDTPLLDVIHNKALSLYKSYLILGGMPEVVLDYINKDRNITKVNLDIQEHIITAYMADMNKYTENTEGITKELDETLIGAYIQSGDDYTPTSDIPTSGYEFNAEKSYCKIGDVVQEDMTLSYDMDTQTLTVSPIAKEGTKCYLYFDEKASGGDYILAGDNAPTNSTTDWTGGTTYYYTGKPNNWVQFAGFWWRIIRINGDGSIRMIYQGTSANETGEGTQIGTSAFNSSSNSKTYVGLVYNTSSQHGYGTNSTIMNTLNTWYNNNLASYETDYIDTGTGFCSDRNMASGYNWSSSTVYYAPHDRRDGTGTLQCNTEDILSKDNGKLQNPIGLVTMDEALLTGIKYSTANTGSYLYTGQTYWTMSPYRFISSVACVFCVNSSGRLYAYFVNGAYGVRPVINLKSAIAISGSGTTSDPFKIQ